MMLLKKGWFYEDKNLSGMELSTKSFIDVEWSPVRRVLMM